MERTVTHAAPRCPSLSPNASEAIKASNAKHRARIALLRSKRAGRYLETDLASLGLPIVIEHFGAWLGGEARDAGVMAVRA